ncbi:MAG: aa3-type cytochrome c oxidase subunit IV [Pseudomonadota bacterium]
MADHEHGSMDTKTQEATYAGFVGMTGKITAAIIVILILMALFIR